MPEQCNLLQRLDFDFNQFSGKFDALLGALNFLISFSAEGNMLSGSLPPTMASLGLKVSAQASTDESWRYHVADAVLARSANM